MVMMCPGPGPVAVVIIIPWEIGQGRPPRECADGQSGGFMWKTQGRDMRGQRGGEIGMANSPEARIGKTLPEGSPPCCRVNGRF